MSTWLAAHPYFAACLVAAPVVFDVYFAFPRRWRDLTLSGVCFCLFAPLALLLNGRYWSPNVLLNLPVGAEDVYYCFALGVTG